MQNGLLTYLKPVGRGKAGYVENEAMATSSLFASLRNRNFVILVVTQLAVPNKTEYYRRTLKLAVR